MMQKGGGRGQLIIMWLLLSLLMMLIPLSMTIQEMALNNEEDDGELQQDQIVGKSCTIRIQKASGAFCTFFPK
jgi:hypothetical protein